MEECDGIIYFKHDGVWVQSKANGYLNKRVKRKYSRSIESIEKVYVPIEECIIEGKTQAYIYGLKPYAIIINGAGRQYGGVPTRFYKGICNSKIKIIIPKYNMFNDKIFKLIMNKKFKNVSAFEQDKVDAQILELDIDSNDSYYNIPYQEKILEKPKMVIKYSEASDSNIQSEGISPSSDSYVQRAFMEVATKKTMQLGCCSAISDYTILSKKTIIFPLWIIKVKINNQESIVIINDSNEKITSEQFFQKEFEKQKRKKISFYELVIGTIVITFLLLLIAIILRMHEINLALYCLVLGIVTIGSITKAEAFCGNLIRKRGIYKVLKRKFEVEQEYYNKENFMNVTEFKLDDF